MTTAAELTVQDLTAALRAQAAGSQPAEAAVLLLIEQGDWLERATFRPFVDYTDDPELVGDTPLARIRWADAIAALDAGELRASGAPSKTLRVAASYGAGIPVDMRENAAGGLGRVHAAYIRRAVARATGGEPEEIR